MQEERTGGARDVKTYERLQVALEPYDEARVIVLSDGSELEKTLKTTLKQARDGAFQPKGTGVDGDTGGGCAGRSGFSRRLHRR